MASNTLYESDPLGLPDPEPIIPEGVSGELRTDSDGKYFVRNEINDMWVSYRFFNEDGTLKRGRAFPRIGVFSDEAIKEMNRTWAIEDAQRSGAQLVHTTLEDSGY